MITEKIMELDLDFAREYRDLLLEIELILQRLPRITSNDVGVAEDYQKSQLRD